MAEMTFRVKTGEKKEIIIGVLDVEVTYPDGRPASGVAYSLKLEPGGTRTGTLDKSGRLSEKNVPPGSKGTLSITGAPVIALNE